MVLCALAILFSGCATSPDGYSGAQTSRLQRLRDAAVRAAVDPYTWVPAAGAVVFSLGDLDQRVSDWAYEHSPIFGSPEDASQASNDLRAIACASSIFTAAAIPSISGANTHGISKTKGLTAGMAAGLANSAVVGFLKDSSERMRPNGQNTRSFPSSHTSQSFACAASASRNLDAVPMEETTRRALRINFTAIAAATAWARIEGHHHYPSDTLAGAAIGNFLANFIYNAFLGEANAEGKNSRKSDVVIDLADDSVRLMFNWSF